MNRIIRKSCDKLIGLMLRQRVYHSGGWSGGGMGHTAGKRPIWFAALNLVVVTQETHTHTKNLFLQAWFIFLFLEEGAAFPEPTPPCCHIATKWSSHSLLITYQTGHQRITWELSEYQWASALLLQLCFSFSAVALAVPSCWFKYMAVLLTLPCLWPLDSFVVVSDSSNLFILLLSLLSAVQPPACTFRHPSFKFFFCICAFPLNLLFRSLT